MSCAVVASDFKKYKLHLVYVCADARDYVFLKITIFFYL